MKKLGKGTFRYVYAYPSDPAKKVVKVPREDLAKYGRAMNKEEIRAAKAFPDLFPSVYNDNLDALVVDRADIFSKNAKIGSFFPSIAKLSRITSSNDWELLQDLVKLLTGKIENADFTSLHGFRGKSARNFAKNDVNLLQIAQATKKLGIDINDLLPENTGVSNRTGQFVIVDASTLSGFAN